MKKLEIALKRLSTTKLRTESRKAEMDCPFSGQYEKSSLAREDSVSCTHLCGVLYPNWFKSRVRGVIPHCPCYVLSKDYVKRRFWFFLKKGRKEERGKI